MLLFLSYWLVGWLVCWGGWLVGRGWIREMTKGVVCVGSVVCLVVCELVLTGLWVKLYYTRMKCGTEG